MVDELPGGPAPFTRRLIARAIDGTVVVVIAALALVAGGLLAGGVVAGGRPPGTAHPLLTYVLLPLVVAAFWRVGGQAGEGGQSLGEALAGVRVVRVDAELPVGLGTALLRFAVGVLGDLPLLAGSLSMLRDPQRRTWSDRLTATAVVTEPPRRPELGRPLAGTTLIALLVSVLGFGLTSGLRAGPSGQLLPAAAPYTPSPPTGSPTLSPSGTPIRTAHRAPRRTVPLPALAPPPRPTGRVTPVGDRFPARAVTTPRRTATAMPTRTAQPTRSPTGSPSPTHSPTTSPSPTHSPTGSPSPTTSPTTSPSPTSSATGSLPLPP